jgi:dTDP-4-dehydrorhamnose reductase/UDP-glucose 4-epimerase
MKIVVVGKNSFLAKRFLALTRLSSVTAIRHNDVHPSVFEGADCVINFALNPWIIASPYTAEADFDLQIAKQLPDTTRYVMLSSRMVYSADTIRVPWGACGAREADPVVGLNQYGKNKLITEAALFERLGSRVTILRIGNVLAWDKTAPRLVPRMLGSLRLQKSIYLDMNPFVRKDFVTEDYLVQSLDRCCLAKPTTPVEWESGVYNLGSGVPLEIGRVALWCIEGFGCGKLVVTSTRDGDEFWLDMTRAQNQFGAPPNFADLRNACIKLGEEAAA